MFSESKIWFYNNIHPYSYTKNLYASKTKEENTKEALVEIKTGKG